MTEQQPVPWQTLTCARCGYESEVQLTDEHDESVSVEDYLAANAALGLEVVCDECTTPDEVNHGR